jgi:hypothetical protein
VTAPTEIATGTRTVEAIALARATVREEETVGIVRAPPKGEIAIATAIGTVIAVAETVLGTTTTEIAGTGAGTRTRVRLATVAMTMEQIDEVWLPNHDPILLSPQLEY